MEKQIKCLIATCPGCGVTTAGHWIDDPKWAIDLGKLIHRAVLRGDSIQVVDGPVTMGERCTCKAKEQVANDQ